MKNLVYVTVVSINGNTSQAGSKLINVHRIVGEPFNDGTYTHFGYDEKYGDRRDAAKEYIVSNPLNEIVMFQNDKKDKIITDIAALTKGKNYETSFAKTISLIVSKIVEAKANPTTASYTDVKYEVDAFKTEFIKINLTLANLIKYANSEKVEYFDDFTSIAGALGTTIANAITLQDYQWDVSGSTSGTVTTTVEADPFNGKLVFDTTSTGSRTAQALWRGACFNGALEKTFATRFLVSNITNTAVKIGWYASANDYCYLTFDTAVHASKIYLASKNNGGAAKSDDTGATLSAATAYDVSITLKGTTILAYVNGVKVAVVNCTARDIDTFVPLMYVDNKAAAEQKTMSVDWVRINHYRV